MRGEEHAGCRFTETSPHNGGRRRPYFAVGNEAETSLIAFP